MRDRRRAACAQTRRPLSQSFFGHVEHCPVLLSHYTGFATELKLWVSSRYKNAYSHFYDRRVHPVRTLRGQI